MLITNNNIFRKRKRVFEKFGVFNLYDSNYDDLIKNISNNVIKKLQKLSNSKDINYDISIINNKSIFYANRLQFNLNLDWLKTLNIYVSLGHYLSINENTIYLNEEPIFAIIDNTGITSFDNNTNDIKYQQIKYTILQEYQDKPNEYVTTYSQTNKEIIIGSIFISIPKDQLHYYNNLNDIIKHELGHLHDLCVQNINTEELNKDIIYSSLLNTKLSNNEISLINNFNDLDTNTKKYIVKNIFTDKHIATLIKNNIELLNISELHQYLINFKADIDKIDNNILSNFNDINKRNNLLCEISPIFKDRYNLLQSLKLIVKYMDNDNKNKFVNNFIKFKFDKIFKELRSQQADNYILFDNFINIFINRLETIFIRNSYLIINNKIKNSDIYENLFYKQSEPLIGNNLLQLINNTNYFYNVLFEQKII